MSAGRSDRNEVSSEDRVVEENEVEAQGPELGSGEELEKADIEARHDNSEDAPDEVVPDRADAVTPDTSGAVVPDAPDAPDEVVPDADPSDEVVPDADAPEAPDEVVPDADAPDEVVPDAIVPDTPDEVVPDADVPDAPDEVVRDAPKAVIPASLDARRSWLAPNILAVIIGPVVAAVLAGLFALWLSNRQDNAAMQAQVEFERSVAYASYAGELGRLDDLAANLFATLLRMGNAGALLQVANSESDRATAQLLFDDAVGQFQLLASSFEVRRGDLIESEARVNRVATSDVIDTVTSGASIIVKFGCVVYLVWADILHRQLSVPLDDVPASSIVFPEFGCDPYDPDLERSELEREAGTVRGDIRKFREEMIVFSQEAFSTS